MAASKKTTAKYVVTGPLCLVKDEQGAVQYLYHGAPIPEYVTGDALQGLLDTGLIGEPDDLAAKPEGDAADGSAE